MQANKSAKWLLLLVLLSGCSEPPQDVAQAGDAVSAVAVAQPADAGAQISEFMRGLSDDITNIETTKIGFGLNGEPVEKPLYYAEVRVKQNFVWGGAQDWNALASTVDRIATKALAREDIGRLRFKVVTEDEKDWAYVDIKRHRLPANWMDGTYLQRFSAVDASSPYPQGSDALCKFYEKYESSRPKDWKKCD